MEQAEELFERAANESQAEIRFRLADRAQDICEKAAADRPKDPKPHFCIARALSITDRVHPEACRSGTCERAIDELKLARALDTNGVDAGRVASELGIVYSRLGRFPEALAEYDRALKLVEAERSPVSHEAPGKSFLYGNSAETLMAMGRLDEAIERYRQAEDAAPSGTIEWRLALWGLGVALDRDEQLEKSRHAIGLAVERDPAMAGLSDESVFFEPAGDKSYYLALGHEQSGERTEALAAWSDYLSVQPHARWAHRARAHIDALKKAPPEVPAGPVEISVGDPILGRTARSRVELSLMMHAHDDDLRRCHARALRRGVPRTQLQGELRIALSLFPSGRPTPDIHLSDTTIGSSDLVQCVQEVLLNWRFPPTDSQELEHLIIPIRFGKRP
jgi:tetratricopeptide (TPR) repeat protein